MRISIRGRVLLVSACLVAGSLGWSQQSPKPVPPAPVSTDLGFTFAVERSQVVGDGCCFWLKGEGVDAAVTFWKGLGAAVNLTGDTASNVEPGVDVKKVNFLAGPRYTWTVWKGDKDHRLTTFGQGLFGVAHGFDGLYPADGGTTTSASSLGIYAGGGLNYYLSKNWGLRLIEADYVRTSLPNALDNAQNDMRLAFGVTYHIEGTPAPAVTLACAASPVTIFPGDPVTVTATAGNLNPKQHAVYSFSGTGVTGTGSTASVATGSLAAGSYTVKCGVKEGKPSKEGLKPWDVADATSSFTVKAFEPPTVGCSASPSTLKPGETATVTATGMSPQNRPLTYSYTATAGTVAGAGATATFSSIGAPTGTAGITCSTTDDKGQTATAKTTVTILAPYVPEPSPEIKQIEARLALHSIFFPTNLPRVKTPEAGLVTSQQGTLSDLAENFKRYLTFKPDARLTLTGHADARGTSEFNMALSERRVARTKSFLMEKGVPEASIETRGLGSEQELTAAQVKDMVEQDSSLSADEREKILRDLNVIVLAQNRRVDVVLSTTGEQSVRQFPFNATDALTLLDKKTPAPHKKAAAKK